MEKKKKSAKFFHVPGNMDFTALRNVTTSGSSLAITFPSKLADEAGIKEHDTVFVELKIKPLEKMTPEDIKKLKEKNK